MPNTSSKQPSFKHEYRHFFLNHRFIKNGPRIIKCLYFFTFLLLTIISLLFMLYSWSVEKNIRQLQVKHSEAFSKRSLENSPYKDVYGILTLSQQKQREGFYPIMRNLSSIKIDNLWLSKFSIYLNSNVIILNGLYNWPNAPDIYVNQLISQKNLFFDWSALIKRENAASSRPFEPAVPNQPGQPQPVAQPNTLAPAAKPFTIFLYRQ